MAKSSDHQADSFGTENTGGLLTGFLAEEEDFDRRFLLKLGTWGAASVGAVIIALMANQSSLGSRREQIASADLMRQLQQVQLLHKESQNETRRLASAIETLNGDRDRLFSRVSTLELGLDSATGALAKQSSPVAPAQAAPPVTPPAPAAAASPVEPQPAPQASNSQASKATPVAAKAAPVVAQVATTAVAVPSAPAPEKKQAAAAEPAPATVSSITPAPAETSKETLKEPPKETSKEVSKEAAKELSKEASSKSAAVTPAANTPAASPAPLVAARSMMGPPDPAAAKLTEPPPSATAVVAAPIPEVVASVVDSDANTASAPVAVQQTEFAVDVGSANSLGGLRALWRGLLKSNSALGALRPIVMVRESNTGFGMQLRLAAGPLSDAATAAKICAALIESERPCQTTVFDGQRLAMKADEQPAMGPKPAKPTQHRRGYYPKRAAIVEPPAPTPEPTTFSSLFSRH